MKYPKYVVSNQKEESISAYRFKNLNTFYWGINVITRKYVCVFGVAMVV